MTQKYDIFISYRRDAFESANLFATRLKALGYRVFFDIETMNAGKFNEQLLNVIRECKDLIPYSALPDSEKEYDRLMAFNTIKLVKKLGWKIAK